MEDVFAEFFVTEQRMDDSQITPELNFGMKASTSKTASSSTAHRRSSQTPPPEEPTVPFVNNNLPNPDDEPLLSSMRGIQSVDEIDRQKTLAARAKFAKTRPDMIADQRAVTAQLFNRYSEDEERKRMEQQKNKEAMSVSAATPMSRNGHVESRKRRSETSSAAEEEWNKRNQQPQQWMGHPNGFQMQQHQYTQQQQHHQMMMQQQQYQMHMQMQHQHAHQMPSTSSAESVRSIPTPASVHQPSPAEMRSRMGMEVSPPSSSMMDQDNGTNLSVPEGEWFDKLALAVAEQYNVETVLGPECYDALLELELPEAPKQSPTNGMDHHIFQTASAQAQLQHQQEQKMRMLQQQQQHMRMQEEQKLMQQQRQQQMLLQQQQLQHQQQQMNPAYIQHVRMQQHLRAQQHHHQQQQHQQQHQSQQHQMMGYGMPTGYPPQMHHMHHAAAYGHHMPQHTPFANIN